MWKGMIVALAVAVAIPSVVTSAGAQERRDERERHERDDGRRIEERHDRSRRAPVRDERTYRNERRDLDRRWEPRAAVHRGDDRWRFERGRGWHFESRPGIWSPYYVWWVVGNDVELGLPPTVTVVGYPYGQYVLQGDGVTVPYYWAWTSNARASAPHPPPVPYAALPDGAGPLPPPPPLAG